MKTFKVTVKQFPFNKKYICKGTEIINHIVFPFVVLILENEERIYVPINKIIKFNSDWFRGIYELVKKESNGQAQVDNGLKENKG